MGISTPLRASVDRASCELLRAVARWPASADDDWFAGLVGEIRDWDALLKLAEEHQVAPMLYARLRGLGPAVPTVTQERLRTAHDRNAFHSLANAAELISVLKAFGRENITAMPYKGVVLAASAYRNLTTRPAGDLDLLVDYSHLPRATAILFERGYEFYPEGQVSPDGGSPSHCGEYHLERRADGMMIELRWGLELAQRHFRRRLGIDWVWPLRRTAMLAGAEVPDMSPEITLLVLCMHGSKHVWSRLIWICDVARLLDSEPDLDWQEAIQEAKRTGLWRTLALGVLLAYRVADAPVPEAVLRSFEADTTACNLAQHVEENLFDSPGSRPVGPLPYSIQLLGFRDRIRFFLSLDFLRPTEKDQAALRLPRWLQPIHYLLRPFRIIRDQSPR